MAERAVPRVTRLLGLVSFLEANGETSFAELASHFGVSEEQIRRDVETLWVSGLPGRMPDDLIDFDADAFDRDVAHLVQGHGVTQVRISPREAVALLGALSSFVAAGVAPEAAVTALSKLRDAVGGADAVTAIGTTTVDPAVASALVDAVARSRMATLEYIDAKDSRTERLVEPQRVVTIDSVAYLECYCHRAGAYRTLRLDRIRSVEVSDDAVVTVPSDVVGFSLEPIFEARVAAARPARWLLEAFPGVAIEHEGDDVVARFGVADVDYVAGRLLVVAPHLRSVSPAPLAEALGSQARAVLSAQV